MESIYKAPDAIGNLFRTPERKDRKYGKGGRLLEDRKYSYHYDSEGNLVLKQRLRPDETLARLWQEGDWAYEWQGNGMLRSVKRPDGETVSFEYDPLGRRISKTYKEKTTRWVWDGNVPLHEWTEEENVTTWLFEEGTFIPAAKIVGDKSYSIITDYLGTPTEMYNSDGEKTWSAELDIYGSVRNFAGRSLSDCPFRYQGQYEDEETGLYYNRFRYYDPNAGNYISQDPIRKPKMSQGLMGATLISQNAAREYLKSINQSYNENSQVNYMEGWRKQIDDISLNYDKVDIIDFDLKFTKLKQSYPNLFAVIKKHLLKSDVVENNLTEEKLTSSFFYKLLHSDVITFFYCISQLKMEGILIDFDMLELRGEYIKIGELWLNSDGDELYIRPYEASVYFHDIGKNQIHIINKSFNLFIENDLSRFVYENA